MLQFNKNQTTNTNAVYVESFNTGSGYYDSLVAVVSQSFDNSNSTFRVSATSKPTQYRHWLIVENSGSEVPSPSGQYDVGIWTATEDGEQRWGFTNEVWGTTDQKWATFGDGGVPIELIASDRAYISGSNESTITQYVSPDENGTYITYNG